MVSPLRHLGRSDKISHHDTHFLCYALTFAGVLIGDIQWSHINDFSSTTAGEVGIQHTGVLLHLLLGVATERLSTPYQHSFGETVVKADNRKPTTMSEPSNLKDLELRVKSNSLQLTSTSWLT